MRIIGGKFKGKSIEFLKSNITRPLKDSVKESIFNIIMHSKNIQISLENSEVIDLYSGVGSFGLECISRGAKKVTFVEKDKKVFQILEKNLSKLSLKNDFKTINEKIEIYFSRNLKNKYSLFFFDPPFLDKSFFNLFKIIKEKNIFKKNHLVIIHREKSSTDDFNNFINSLIIRKYGRSKIIFGKFI